MSDPVRAAVRCGAIGYALGSILALSCRARVEVALGRALFAALAFGLITFVVTSLNDPREAADEDTTRTPTSAD